MQQPYPAAHEARKTQTPELDRRTVTGVVQDMSMEDQSDLVTASPDPRNPWWELRVIRLLALRDERRHLPAAPIERAA